MKIYTIITENKRDSIIKDVERNSTAAIVAPARITEENALAFNYWNDKRVSCAPSGFYANEYGIEKVSNAEFVRLIAKELPREKPDLCREIFGTDFGHTSKQRMMSKAYSLSVDLESEKEDVVGLSDMVDQLKESEKSLSENLHIANKSAVDLRQKLTILEGYKEGAEFRKGELQTEIDSLKKELSSEKKNLHEFRKAHTEQIKRAESAEAELSNLKKNIMLLSGVAMGVKV